MKTAHVFGSIKDGGEDLIKDELAKTEQRGRVEIGIGLQTLTRKFDMELVFRFQDLDVEGAVRGEILHCPCSQYRLMILTKSI